MAVAQPVRAERGRLAEDHPAISAETVAAGDDSARDRPGLGAEAAWDGSIATEVPGVRRSTMTSRRVGVLLAVAATLGALLNAVPMERDAETSAFGTRRDLSLAVLRPLAGVATALRLDRPRAALDSLAGHDGPAGGGATRDSSDGSPLQGGSLAPVGTPLVEHVRRPVPPPQPWWLGVAAGGAVPQATPAPASTPAPPPTRPPVRMPSPADPLRIWVGGDSVAGYFGFGMDDLAQQSGGVVASHSHYKTSTGLSRPDYFDWPAHLEADMQTYNPEVVVFLVGANDDQPLQLAGGGVAGFGTDAWRAEYARRTGAVMDRLIAEHRMVVWVGQPVMRSADFDARMQLMDGIYSAEAAKRAGVVYFDSRPVLEGPGAQYSAYLPDGGAEILMRAADGIHLTPAGGHRLARAVLDTVLTRVAAGQGPPDR